VLIVVLLIVFVIRVALTVLLIVVAPLALACHVLPVTHGCGGAPLSGVLMIQLAQVLALIVALQVFFTPDGVAGFVGGGVLMDLVVTLVMVWVLVRIPAWVGRHIGAQPSAMTRVLKYATLSRALKHVPTSRGSGRSSRAGRSQANRRGSA
jgi:hypothetical protein